MSDPIDPTTDPENETPTEDAVPESAEPVTAEAAEPVEAEIVPVEAETEAVVEAAPARRTRAPRGPRPYAIIKTGGKQYRVSVGDTITVEKLDGEAGNDITSTASS